MNQYNSPSDIAILGMGTALPAHPVAQSDIAELIASSLQDRPDLARFARRIFKSCGVETRYTWNQLSGFTGRMPLSALW